MDEVSFSDLSIVASGGVSYSKDLIYLLNTRLRTNRTSLWVWGYNSSGQLGLDDTTDRLKPVVLDFFNGREIKKVVQSASSSYVLTMDGFLFAWGNNANGELGIGTDNDSEVPLQILDAKRIIDVSCSLTGSHVLALTDDYMVYSWGENSHGCLGLGHVVSMFAPTEIESLRDKEVRRVYAGGEMFYGFSYFVTKSNQVYVCGRNDTHQLGIPEEEDVLVPKLVPELSGTSKVALGSRHTLILKTDGTVWSHGVNDWGMLGRQNSEDVVTAEIQELRDEQIVQISCGGEYSLALTRSGDVFAWGSNNQGQLGHGGRRGSRVPKRIDVLAGKKIVKIVAGWKHTMYMTDTGVLYAAGFNFKGQLGLGIDTNIDQLVPVEITFLSEKRVLMIGAGANHSFAVVAYENK